VRSGLHYIAVNLLASSLFLVGLAVLYGVTGTLSMADIADKFPSVPAVDRGLLHAGVAILAVAFLVKAAIWPLNAWLVPAYTATSAPVAALFALMTKVGIYALVRLWTLFFAPGADPSGQFGGSVLVCGGVLTMAFATLGLIASMRVGRIAAFSIILSSGTLLAAFALGTVSVTSAALFYLLSGTLAASALFLLVELVERIGSGSRSTLPDVEVDEDTNLDDEESPLVGRAFPISITFLGLSFAVCAVLVVGLPPLSGFVAKFALLDAIVGVGSAGWWIAGGLLVSGLAGTISLSRAGIRHFWAIGSSHAPKVAVVEAVSVFGLLLSAILLTVSAEPVLRYTRATAVGLHSPRPYVDAVLSAKPRTKGSP
jgi:multicomponent K+:H+ antiporter subunit D